MSLLSIKQHMLKVKVATLSHLCQLWGEDPEMVRCMMSHWIRKGRIRCSSCTSACKACPMRCQDVPTIEVYEWVSL